MAASGPLPAVTYPPRRGHVHDRRTAHRLFRAKEAHRARLRTSNPRPRRRARAHRRALGALRLPRRPRPVPRAGERRLRGGADRANGRDPAGVLIASADGRASRTCARSPRPLRCPLPVRGTGDLAGVADPGRHRIDAAGAAAGQRLRGSAHRLATRRDDPHPTIRRRQRRRVPGRVQGTATDRPSAGSGRAGSRRSSSAVGPFRAGRSRPGRLPLRPLRDDRLAARPRTREDRQPARSSCAPTARGHSGVRERPGGDSARPRPRLQT